jgi:hypothetical protein
MYKQDTNRKSLVLSPLNFQGESFEHTIYREICFCAGAKLFQKHVTTIERL